MGREWAVDIELALLREESVEVWDDAVAVEKESSLLLSGESGGVRGQLSA